VTELEWCPVREWLAAKNGWRHGENFFLDSPFIEPLPVLTRSKRGVRDFYLLRFGNACRYRNSGLVKS